VRTRIRGASIFEFAIVVLVACTVALVFLDRVAFYLEQAEKAAMQRSAADMSWALRIRVAELMLANDGPTIAALDGANPVEALDFQLGTYAGSGPGSEEARIPAGRWFFNRDSRELVYFPNYDASFSRPQGVRARVSWRIVVVREAPRLGAASRASWARLELVRPYRWLEVSEAAPVLC
jgi:hypothetical protein